jgi:hypothetical protein
MEEIIEGIREVFRADRKKREEESACDGLVLNEEDEATHGIQV